MMIETLSPFDLLGIFLLHLLVAATASLFPRKMERWFLGLVSGSFLGILGFSLWHAFRIMGGEIERQVWQWGWVGKTLEPLAIHVGLILDPLALIFMAVISYVGLLSAWRIWQEQSALRRYLSALSLSICGASLSWVALTPWLNIAGTMLCVLGGLVSLGVIWEPDNPEADFASRFLSDHAVATITQIVGACVLLASGLALRWDEPVELTSRPGAFEFGALLLTVGSILHFRVFPLMGWIVQKSKTPFDYRYFFTQIWIGLSVLALLSRMDGVLGQLGLLNTIGWIAGGLAFVSFLPGLFQEDWQNALSQWLAAGFSLCMSGICFGGDRVGTAFVLCFFLVGASFAFLSPCLSPFTESRLSKRGNLPSSAKTAIVLASALGSGAIGFVSAGAYYSLFLGVMDDLAVLLLLAMNFFLIVLLLWKTAWQMLELTWTQVGTGQVVLPFATVFVSLGVWWWGSLSGGALPFEFDGVVRPFLDVIYLRATSRPGTMDNAYWIYWAVLILAFLLSIWMRGIWPKLYRAAPGMTHIFQEVYYLHRFSRGLFRTLGSTMAWTQELLDSRFWLRSLTRYSGAGTRWIARTLALLDSRGTRALERGFARTLKIPSAVVNSVQNGNLQWYLFFALTWGMIMLVYFYKK